MAYNSMTVLRQNPYAVNNNQGFVNRKNEENEDASKSKASNSLSTSNPNIDANNQKPQKEQEDIRQQLVDSKAAHQRAIVNHEAKLKSATVNIAQILKDFRSTGKAIGASPELTEEVNMYLELAEKQVSKDEPDVRLVKSNLKNAASLFDEYISETLQRPSKVVANWIEALFLQNVDYKYNEEEINKNFLVKFPDQKEKDEERNQDEEQDSQNKEENQDEEISKKSIFIPTDEKLKSLFIKAKKFAFANNSQKAMELFKAALDRAIEIEDKETESKVLFEIGKIYDKHDYLAQALTSYNKALYTTKDISVKTKAHFSMAQIYDDVAQFESAINHYMSSISYAGESENFTAQSTSLTKIGNIYTDKYKDEAFDFFVVAENIAKESENSKTKGYVAGNIANAYNKFNKPKDALKYYSSAVNEYDKAELTQKVALNYKRAAELMQDYNNNEKAKKLFKKALAKARQTDNVKLMKEIHEALSAI